MDATIVDSLAQHPDVKIAGAQYQQGQEELRAAESVYYPSIDLNVGYGKEWSDTPTTRATQSDVVSLGRGETGLVVRQMVFDGARLAGVDGAELTLLAREKNVNDAEERATFETIQVFHNVLRNRRILELAKDNLAAHDKVREKVERRLEAGASAEADLRQIQSRESLARVVLAQAQASTRNAESQFQRVVGRRPADELIDNLDIESKLPATEEIAVVEAVRTHPAIEKATMELRASREDLRALKARYWPSVSLEASLNNNKNIDGVEGASDSRQLMLRMQYNLFNGGGDSARIQRATYKAVELEESLDKLRRQITEGVQKAWTNYAVSQEKLAYLRQQSESALAVRNAYRKQFDAGRRSLLDVLTGESELHTARRDLVGAEHDRFLAAYNVRFAMGRLRTDLPSPADDSPSSRSTNE